MGHDGLTQVEVTDALVTDPVVRALSRAWAAENTAVFEQLSLISVLWEQWRPTDADRRDDRRRGRRDTAAQSLHEACVVTETAVTLRMTEHAAARRVQAAVALLVTGQLAFTARLAQAGRLAWRQIDALATKTRELSPEQAAQVEALVLTPAGIGLTIGRFEDAVDRAVICVDPAAAERRRQEVRRGRRVSFFKQRNGTEGADAGGTFWAEGPADGLTAVMACLNASATWWQKHGDPRTMDQLRHDLFVTACTTGRLDIPHDIITTTLDTTLNRPTPQNAAAPQGGAGTTAGPHDGAARGAGPQNGAGPGGGTRGGDAQDEAASRDAAAAQDGSAARGGGVPAVAGIALAPRPQVPAHINVTVSLQTLLALNDEPGTLDQYGPIPAQMIREMADHGIWRCLVVDDTHGTILGVGKHTYTHSKTPGTNLTTFLDLAAPECEIPWCTTRATHCDAEHHTPHDTGGATCSCNVGTTCRRHHRLKTADNLPVKPSSNPHHPPGTNIRTTPGGREIIEYPYTPLPPEAYLVARREPDPEPQSDSEPRPDSESEVDREPSPVTAAAGHLDEPPPF